MRTGPTKQEKTTDIWFDEKNPLIHIRTHNTDLKNRLTAYAAVHPGECRQTDADPDTGCMEFVIAKLKAEIDSLKQEISDYKSVHSKLRAAELERENTERDAAGRQAKQRKTNKSVLGLR